MPVVGAPTTHLREEPCVVCPPNSSFHGRQSPSGAEKSAIAEEMASRRKVKLVPEPILARTGGV